MTSGSDDALAGILSGARAATREAGELALGWFRPHERTSAKIAYKSGGSPVTAADLAVDALLRQRLLTATTDFGWLSEETADGPDRLSRRDVWIVDPIDGTRAFARGDADWTVAVGLVRDGIPVAGFVYAPVLGEFFEAAPGGPALLNGAPIRVSARASLSGALIGGPRAILDRFQAAEGWRVGPRVHSLALRLAQAAAGRLDAAIAAENAQDWDIAAVHAVLSAAGGTLVAADGQSPRYNRRTIAHRALAAGPAALALPLAAIISGGARDRRLSEEGTA